MWPMCTSIAAAALSVLGSEISSTCRITDASVSMRLSHLQPILKLKSPIVPVVLCRLGDVWEALLDRRRHPGQFECQSLQ